MRATNRKYGQRKQSRGYYHSRAISDSYTRSIPVVNELPTVLSISTMRQGIFRQSHETHVSNTSFFDPQMASYSGDPNTNRQPSSPKQQNTQVNSHDFGQPRRKRTKSLTERERPGHEMKRGEKWTEEEEALLRQRRNGEPESWEETGKYFVGRTTNALQKKWKLMTLSDKMKIEPELENQLMVAVAKHAPSFYRQLALEMKMSDDEVEIIVEKISILFMQGKLPLRASSPNVIPCENMSSAILQKTCPASTPLTRTYSTGPHGRPPEGPEFQVTGSYLPYQPSRRNKELESPEEYSSDTEDSVHYQPDDENGVSENPLIFYWNEDPHFHSSFFIDKAY